MKTIDWSKYALGTLAVAGILAGCSGGGSSPAGLPPSGMPFAQSNSQQSLSKDAVAMLKAAGIQPDVAHPDLGHSWMNPDVKKKPQPLLYVSDVTTKSVNVYTYRANRVKIQVGALLGFHAPYGLCTDGKHVWAVDVLDSSINEYQRGGTAPINVLSDPGFEPIGCAYDKTTGNLAVTNLEQSGGGPGNIAVYTGAAGAPAYHFSTNIYAYFFAGYDNSGNLFVDGEASVLGPFAFAELAKNASQGTPIKLNQAIKYPGGVQWDGSDVAVTDALSVPPTAHEFKISGNKGMKVDFTPFTGAAVVLQSWIDIGTATIFGPDPTSKDIGLYKYRVGGNPFQMIGVPLKQPIGAVVTRN